MSPRNRSARSRHALAAVALVLSSFLSGCFSVVAGRSFGGQPMTQQERSAADAPFYFFWRTVPSPPPEGPSAGALLANLGVSFLIDATVVLVIVFIVAVESDGEQEQESEEQRR